MDPEPTLNIVEIAGDRYQVRRTGEQRLVRVGSRWLDPQQFVSYLLESGKVDSVADLMEFGLEKLRGN